MPLNITLLTPILNFYTNKLYICNVSYMIYDVYTILYIHIVYILQYLFIKIIWCLVLTVIVQLMTGSIYYSSSIEIGITVTTDIMKFIVITDLQITINSLDTSTVINIWVGIVGKKSDISISTNWNRYDYKDNKYDIK